MRGFAAKTRASHLRSVARLAKYCGKSPETLAEEAFRRYFVHLACERRLSRSTVKIAPSGIKFLFAVTLRRDFALTGVAYPKKSKALPAVLSPDEARARRPSRISPATSSATASARSPHSTARGPPKP